MLSYPWSPHCPGEGWQRAVWRFPTSRSLWTWGSSDLNRSGRIPSHHHVRHSWCSCPGDAITWFKILPAPLQFTPHAFIFKVHQGRLLFHFTVCQIISVPLWDSCNQRRSQGKASSSALLTFPSACSKRCGNFSHQVPAHERTLSSPQEHFTCTMLLLGANIQLTWWQTLDFSSRYCSILAPSMAPRLLKWMSMYFPKRLELSLRIVLAFPKAEWNEIVQWGVWQHKLTDTT